MSLNANYQKLEPGDEIRLFEIDGRAFNMGEVLYFHGYNVPHSAEEIIAAGGDEAALPAKSIWWQGIEYKAWPCELEGIESSTSGSDAQPTLRVGNIDGSITALCLYYDDMAQARVTIHETQSSISMRKTSRRETRPQIPRRKSVGCILSMPKILKPTKRWSSPYQARWTCRG